MGPATLSQFPCTHKSRKIAFFLWYCIHNSFKNISGGNTVMTTKVTCCLGNFFNVNTFYSELIQSRWYIAMPCPALSVCPSVLPSLPLYRPVFNRSYSYLLQPLTLERAWSQLILGLCVLFSGSLWHFEILWIHFWLVFGACLHYRSTTHNI